ncbi:MAG: hypothetical protein C4343_04780 [Chloroflexota bacterium]
MTTPIGGPRRPRVAVAQTAPRLGDVEANLAEAEEWIAGLAGRADLVVFPELFTTGYNRDVLDHAALAEPLPDGPSAMRLGAAAASAGIAVAGTILERAGSTIFDTAVVFDRQGRLVARYRKSHLHPEERPIFGQGDELLVVSLAPDLRLGLAICFEHAFPEIFAELALAGANVIAIPSAVPEGFAYLLELRTRARAQDNQVFVAASNLSGDDGRTRWCGRSVIVDPRGEVLAAAGASGPALIIAELDLGLITREREQEPLFGHRRPELYRRLRTVSTAPDGLGTASLRSG